MTVIGANVEELEQAAQQLDEGAAQLERSAKELSGTLGSFAWLGRAAIAFTDSFSSRHKPRMITTAAFLRDNARALREQAQQQRRASETGGAGGGGGLGPLLAMPAPGLSSPLFTVPAAGASAAAIAAWWRGLSEQDQKSVMNSLSGKGRDRINRTLLKMEKSRIAAELYDMAPKSDKGWGVFTNDDRRAELLREKLQALEAVEKSLGDPENGRQLLLLDLTGNKALAAISVGDIDTAEHVTVMVPGVGTSVAEEMGREVEKAEGIQSTAGHLSGDSVAAVAWIGYETPEDVDLEHKYNITDADDLNKARVGSESLRSFLGGIDSIRNGDVHLSVLGHSYGSTTAGLALQPSSMANVVDDVVFYGSPGLGASSGQVPPGHAYLMEAAWDPIADVGSVTGLPWLGIVDAGNVEHFGGDPSGSTFQGLTRLSSGESIVNGTHLSQSTGHSQYMNLGTTSQHNAAAVVVGRRDLLVTE